MKQFYHYFFSGVVFLFITQVILAGGPDIRISSPRVNFEQAANAGLDGVELLIRNPMHVAEMGDPAYRENLLKQAKKNKVVISSLSMVIFNNYPMFSDPNSAVWLHTCIDAAHELGAGSILMAFFIKGDLYDRDAEKIKQAEVDSVVSVLKMVADHAERKNIKLGLENMLSAEQNMEIIRRVGSDAITVYYDVRNVNQMGYNIPAEIRMLDKHICQFHFKNGKQYMGEGGLDFEPFAEAIKDIGYKGWITLETSGISGDAELDAKREAAYVRKLFRLD